MNVEYTWILWKGKNYRQFSLLTWNLFIGQFVHPVGGSGGIGIKGVKGDIDILPKYKFHFFNVHDNLLLDPCKSISQMQWNCHKNSIFNKTDLRRRAFYIVHSQKCGVSTQIFHFSDENSNSKFEYFISNVINENQRMNESRPFFEANFLLRNNIHFIVSKFLEIIFNQEKKKRDKSSYAVYL